MLPPRRARALLRKKRAKQQSESKEEGAKTSGSSDSEGTTKTEEWVPPSGDSSAKLGAADNRGPSAKEAGDTVEFEFASDTETVFSGELSDDSSEEDIDLQKFDPHVLKEGVIEEEFDVEDVEAIEAFETVEAQKVHIDRIAQRHSKASRE